MQRKYRSLKPHDIIILGKLLVEDSFSSQVHISEELQISQSEVSLGLKALERVGLINNTNKKVNKVATREFITHAVKYLCPIEKEGTGRGFLTGPSSPFFNKKVHSSDIYVWPHEDGDSRGMIINALVSKISKAIILNEDLYLFLSITDIFRGLGGVRHLKEAEEQLKRLLNE